MAQVIEITLTEEQRQELEAIVARPSEGAGLVRRARVILLSARGVSGREIALRLDLTPEHVSVIRARFRDEGVAGLHERPKSGRTDHAVAPATVEKIVQLAMSPPPAGRNDLKPHVVRTYKVSRDPEFVAKVEDVVGLYLSPPEHAVVLSVDEKTSIQALQRTQ